MIADVEVANAGFNEAMASLANLGRVIDRAIPRASLASLGLPRIPAAVRFSAPSVSGVNPGAGALDLAHLDNGTAESDSSGQAQQNATSPASTSSFPPLPAIKPLRPFPPLPGVKPLQGLDQAISNLTRPIDDCCSKLSEAVGEMKKAVASIETISKAIEACKCTTLPDEVKKTLDRITDGIREAAKPNLADRVEIAGAIGTALATITSFFSGLAFGSLLGLGATGTILGGFAYYDHLNPDPFEMRERSRRDLEGLEKLSEPYRHPGPESNPNSFPTFPYHYFRRSLDSFLEELIRNIESPEDSPEARALRHDSLEVLPDIIKDYED
ncbi:MAG: hypothetical protein L0210_09080, partial [Rhodospirillales bacterium]|nr:hypothetical protein [Rhodospirillales bacterium]